MTKIKNDGNYTASYSVPLARKLGSVNAAIILDKLNYLQRQTRRGDGYCWRTARELEMETALSERQQSLAIKKLEDAGLIEVKNTYIIGTQIKCKHFRVNMDNFDELAKSDYDERVISDFDILLKSENDEMSKSVNNNYTVITKHNTLSKDKGVSPVDDAKNEKSEQKEFGNVDINDVLGYWAKKTNLPITSKVKQNRYAVQNMLKNKAIGKDKLLRLIDGVAKSQSDPYAPGINDLVDLQHKMNALLVWGNRQKAKKEAQYQPPAEQIITPVKHVYDGMPEFREVHETVDADYLQALKDKLNAKIRSNHEHDND